MTKYIIIDEGLLKYILSKQAQNIVGKCMKRFEIHTDKEEIKKAVKELLYENYRDLENIIKTSSQGKDSIYLEKGKG